MLENIKKALAVFSGLVIALGGVFLAVLLGRRRGSGSGPGLVSGEDSGAAHAQADLVRGEIQQIGQSLSDGQGRLDESERPAIASAVISLPNRPGTNTVPIPLSSSGVFGAAVPVA